VRDFRTRYGGTYTSNFPQEPPVRPSYIPSSTIFNGQTVNIYYDPGYHSYGYYRYGRWTAFDALADAVVLDSLMNHHSYYYGQSCYGGQTYYGGVVPGGYGTTFVSQSSVTNAIGTAVVILIVVVMFVIIAAVISKARSGYGMVAADDNPYSPSPVMQSRSTPPPFRATPPPAPVAMADAPPSQDMDNAGFWENLKPGALVTLSDELAMQDSLEKTGKSEGVSYTVRAIRRIQEARQLGQWVMLHLQGNYPPFTDQHLWFVAKVVDDKLSLLVYEQVKDLPPGSRKDFIDRGDLWVFQKPENPDQIVYNRLRYTVDMTRFVQTPSGEKQIVYTQKPQGELQGRCSEQPAPSGMTQPLLATVVEYTTDTKCDNPELLLLELGGDGDEGGNITLMEGGPINPAEVTVL
jgi:hypothetical protein